MTNRNPGVVWDKQARRWRARIYIKQKGITIGKYVNEEDAARARARFLRQLGREG